jgi:signal peptidase I
VLSGSMEPGFHRGDILFLNMGTAPVRTGVWRRSVQLGSGVSLGRQGMSVH